MVRRRQGIGFRYWDYSLPRSAPGAAGLGTLPGGQELGPTSWTIAPPSAPPRHRFLRPRERSLGSGFGGILGSLAHAPPVFRRGYGRWSGGGRGAWVEGVTGSAPGVDLTIGVPQPRRHGWLYIRSVGVGRMVSPGLSLGGASHVGTTGGHPTPVLC